MPDLADIAERLSVLTVIEAAELSRLLEAKWGVSAAAPVALTRETVTPAEFVTEVQTEFTVILVGVDPPEKKISVIKEIRAITGLGLKEAKEFVEGAPKMVRESVSNADADKLKEQLEAAGGKVEVK